MNEEEETRADKDVCVSKKKILIEPTKKKKKKQTSRRDICCCRSNVDISLVLWDCVFALCSVGVGRYRIRLDLNVPLHSVGRRYNKRIFVECQRWWFFFIIIIIRDILFIYIYAIRIIK